MIAADAEFRDRVRAMVDVGSVVNVIRMIVFVARFLVQGRCVRIMVWFGAEVGRRVEFFLDSLCVSPVIAKFCGDLIEVAVVAVGENYQTS